MRQEEEEVQVTSPMDSKYIRVVTSHSIYWMRVKSLQSQAMIESSQDESTSRDLHVWVTVAAVTVSHRSCH